MARLNAAAVALVCLALTGVVTAQVSGLGEQECRWFRQPRAASTTTTAALALGGAHARRCR